MPPTLHIPASPTFPFSSPITEEIPSPASSSPERHGMDMGHRPNPSRRVDVEVLNTTRQTPLVHDQYTAHKKSMIADTETHVSGPPPANPGKGKPLGLNLVTDFDSLAVPRQTKQRSPTLVDLTDLKTLCRKRERERSAQKIRGFLKKRRSRAERAAAEGRLDVHNHHHHEHQKKKRKSELSPYDRPIPIGLTVPYAESSDAHAAAHKADLSAADHQQAPSIVVTPAGEDSFWEDDIAELEPPQTDFHPRPSVASSIYSQPTPLPMFDEEIPPVPAIPASHSASKLATPVSAMPPQTQTQMRAPIVQQPRSGCLRRKSRFSPVTEFEDDSPQSASSSSNGTKTQSHETKKKALDRLSINTDTNRPQSQGWWTYLLSPLFKRSSTATSSKTPTSPDRPPLLPRGELAAEDSKVSADDWWEKDEGEISCFSPDTPESSGANESRLSRNPFLERNVSKESSSDASAGAAGMFAGQAISGYAAEYYQACAHELFSGTPYFECTNHVCSITPVTQQQQTGRVLVVDDGCEHDHGNTAKGLDEHKSPNSEKTRIHHFSGSTAINETPLVKGKATPPNPAVYTGKPVHLVVPEDPKDARPTTPVTPFYLPIDQEKTKSKDPNTPPPNAHTTITVQKAIPHHIVVPQSQSQSHGQPQSPNPISPAFQLATEGGSIPLSKVQNTVYTTENHHVSMHGVLYTDDGHAIRTTRSSPPHRPEPIVTRGVPPTSDRHHSSTHDDNHERTCSETETSRRRHEKEEKVGKKASCLRRGRGSSSKKGCFGRSGRKGRKKRRCCIVVAFILLVIVVIALLLAVFLTRKAGGGNDSNNNKQGNGNSHKTNGNHSPSQWLNLTGYPPMPTGIATIAGPKPRVQQSGCIHPTTLWSCALPKEQQDGNQPYDADEPSFRVEIHFQNGTYPQSTRLASRGVNASEEPSPSPPSQLDQQFLGNTTDGNEAPFDGEETPFYMSFLSTHNSSSSSSSSSTSSGLSRRSSVFPNLADIIPSPATQPNGTAAPATLYPLPESQPIRLYNRGKDTEHYGFYTYFDRSIFLASSAPLDGGVVDSDLTDRNGGSSLDDASVRCTWAQTRFLVQIWTGQAGKTLLQADSSGGNDGNYTRPGTFPYPVTITLDRHGGTAKQKMVYCYGMDDDGGRGLNSTAAKLQIEDRGYKGSLISPAPGVFNSAGQKDGQQDEGVDGGDGGCKCQWANWT